MSINDTEQQSQCTKRVFSGERWDTRGHQCGNRALSGTAFCGVHTEDDGRRVTREATKEPTLSSSTVVTHYATLTWLPGAGPVVPVPYQTRSGFITRAAAKRVDGQEALVSVQGLIAKKDGTPGQQPWSARFNGDEVLPSPHLRTLLDAVKGERP